VTISPIAGSPANVRAMWEKGYIVVPLKDKSPAHLGKRWQDRAPTNLAEALALFREHPGDIGIFTPASGLLVADVDVKDGKQGRRTWASLIRTLGPNGAHTVETPSGGLHAIWRMAPGHERDNAMLGPGVDVRAASNGVVVGYHTPDHYPSLHDLLVPPESWLDEFARNTRAPIDVGELEYSDFEPSAQLLILTDEWDGVDHDRSEWFYKVVSLAYDEGALSGDSDWLMSRLCAEKYEERGDLEEQFALCWLKAERAKRTIDAKPGGGIGLAPKGAKLTEREKAAINDPKTFHGNFIVRCLDDVEEQPTLWLWDDRIPLGELTLIAGREGVGKSTYLAHLAARITNGTAQGDLYGKRKGVLYIAQEDSWSRTIKPRMMAAGADMKKVFYLDVVEDGTPLTIPEHSEVLASLATDYDVAAIMFDPIVSVIDDEISTDKTRELRTALEPLRKEAERAGVALLALVHHNKTPGTDANSKIAGARGWTEVARAIIQLVQNPEDEDTCILSSTKNNLGKLHRNHLLYEIKGKKFSKNGQEIRTSRIEFTGSSTISAQSVLEGRNHGKRGRPVTEETKTLIEIIKDKGPISTSELAKTTNTKYEAVRKTLVRAEARQDVKRDVDGHWVVGDPIQDEVDSDN